MISFKEYADSHRITYESVRKQVKRYKQELTGHITVQNRKQYLDDYAVEFLNKRRNKNTVTILNAEAEAESVKNEELQAENKQLLYKIAQLQEQLLEAEKEKVKGIEAFAKLPLLEEKVAQLEAENATFVRTIFGLYKKKSVSGFSSRI
jgi:hypothetical protein